MSKKTLWILCGVPGSGKSFRTAELMKKYDGAVKCSADDFMVDEDGNYAFSPDKLGWAHQSCRSKTEKSMKDGVGVIIIDNTNTSARELKPYRKLAKRFNYEVVEELVGNLDEESIQKYAERCVHNVPAEHVHRMAQRLRDRLGVK